MHCKSEQWDEQFTGAYPRYSGAKSAVTGGPPEDINEMPAAEDPEIEGPTYDGSDALVVPSAIHT